MINDIISIKDAMNFNLISRLELRELDIAEQDILIEIRSYQADRQGYQLW